jgi:transcription elongation GreA/GreB family factor
MRIDKQSIHYACVQRQQELIDNFSTKVEEMKKELFNRDTIPSQEDHKPAERIEILDSMENELQFLHFEMNILKNLDSERIRTEVDPGTVVVTDRRVFYICVSIEEVIADGQPIFGISTQAPLYQMMVGKKVGESFSFNNTTYQILDLY